jgi:hypothetical protein
VKRTIKAIITTGAGLALVVGMTNPAHAATRKSLDEARGDVRTNDGGTVSRAEKKIDMLGEIRFRTVADGRKDLLTVRVKGRDFRGSGKHFMYLTTRKANGGSTFVMANLNGNTARTYTDSFERGDKCRGGGVRADLRRDVAVLRMPSRCLGGGDRVRIADAGTLFARNASIESVTAYDGRDSGDTTILLDYR